MMAQSALYNPFPGKKFLNSKKLPVILCAVFITMAGLMIFQDYLEAGRQGRAFYFSESLLFKTIWFIFIPVLAILYKRLNRQRTLDSYSTAFYIIIPIILHFLIIPVVFLFFSIIFYSGRYDLYKILTYTLANDFSVLIIVYCTFVLGYKYFSEVITAGISADGKKSPETLVVNNGKDNTVINISEIVQIGAATPYVCIQLKDKKYLHTATLRSINELLDQKDFIRVHKSAIVNIHKVISFKSRLNGDYDLHLSNGETIRLSRTFAAGFKKRFKTPNRVST